MPDLFVPIDTVGASEYFGQLNYRGMFYQFGFDYVDKHRKELMAEYNSGERFLKIYSVSNQLLSEFADYAEIKGITMDEAGMLESKELIKNRLKATIGRNLFGDEVFYPIVNTTDITITKAIESFR